MGSFSSFTNTRVFNWLIIASLALVAFNFTSWSGQVKNYVHNKPRPAGAACLSAYVWRIPRQLCLEYSQLSFSLEPEQILGNGVQASIFKHQALAKNMPVQEPVARQDNHSKPKTPKDLALSTASNSETSLAWQIQPELSANTLFIPSLKIQAPLIYAQGNTETAFQEALMNGVVHYPGTAFVGKVGNSYFFGHSSDFSWSKGKFKKVFAKLPTIQKDALIFISDASGNNYIYKVYTTAIVSATDASVLAQSTAGRKILTLQTSYPVGTAQKRFIAQSELIE